MEASARLLNSIKKLGYMIDSIMTIREDGRDALEGRREDCLRDGDLSGSCRRLAVREPLDVG